MKVYDLNDPEVLAKLPRGMQLAIQALQSDNRRMREELAVGPEDSDTFVSGGHVTPDRPLGTHVTINFGVTRHTSLRTLQEVTDHVLDARWDADTQTLLVSAYNGRVNIRPGSSNAFEVTVTRH